MNRHYRSPMHRPKLAEVIIFLLLWSLVILFSFFLSGCSKQKKIQKAVKSLKKYEVLADTCAANFPVKDSVYVKDSVRFDTLYLETPAMVPDTIYIQGKAIPFFRECPPSMQIVKTVTRDSVIIRRDFAMETALQEKAENFRVLYYDTQEKLFSWKDKAKTRFWWLMAVIAVITVGGVYKIIRLIK